MPITRSQFAGADNAANFEEVETSATSGSSEVRELRGQLAALTDLVTQQAKAARQQTEAARRQEARMKQRRPPRPVLRVRRLWPHPGGGLGGTTCAEAPVGAVFPTLVEGAERDRLMERLNEFRRCSPRVFDGEKVDHWIVEKWLMHMEKLFRDTFVEERDRVWLATHTLDGEAYRWCRVREGVFSASDCVPFVVRDDEDKARIFERGLRPSIFRFVQSSNLQTYREVVDRALIVESGAADVQEQREARDKGKAKRPAAEGASQTHSRRPPKASEEPAAWAWLGDSPWRF
uniref:Retrotransposon gag domain-containing protein n=1 Tax=Ananas comosus var. bracteatus TaxID=296719 RepID=A0A6V7PY07_ANACO|nr:unnamed protein product [Ananas comosus var. bracteatus]